MMMEDANKEDAIVVAVTRDGRTFLGGDQVSVDDLGAKISRQAGEQDRTKRSYLRARRSCELRQSDGCGRWHSSAGVSQLGLLTEKRDD